MAHSLARTGRRAILTAPKLFLGSDFYVTYQCKSSIAHKTRFTPEEKLARDIFTRHLLVRRVGYLGDHHTPVQYTAFYTTRSRNGLE